MSSISISTYDYLSIVSHELQISPPTVNSLLRVAWFLCPEHIERIKGNFVPNLWINRILMQLPDDTYGIVDATLWYNVYNYLKNHSNINHSDFIYPADRPFEEWFAEKVSEIQTLTVNTSTPYEDTIKDLEVTKEYVDIHQRLALSMYVLKAFGDSPKKIMQDKLVATNVIKSPVN